MPPRTDLPLCFWHEFIDCLIFMICFLIIVVWFVFGFLFWLIFTCLHPSLYAWAWTARIHVHMYAYAVLTEREHVCVCNVCAVLACVGVIVRPIWYVCCSGTWPPALCLWLSMKLRDPPRCQVRRSQACLRWRMSLQYHKKQFVPTNSLRKP